MEHDSANTWWVGPGASIQEHRAAKTAALEAAARVEISTCKTDGHEPKNITVQWIDGAVTVLECCRCKARGYKA